MLPEKDTKSSNDLAKARTESKHKLWQRRFKMATAVIGLITMIVALFKCENSPINVNRSETNINYNMQKEVRAETLNNSNQVAPQEKKVVVVHEYHNAGASLPAVKYADIKIQNPDEDIPEESYLNTGLGKCDIAIVVTDEHNQIAGSIQNEVCSLYQAKGLKVNRSLFTEKFIHSALISKLKSGSAAVANKLSLSDFARYIVIGKYRFKLRDNPGGYVKYVGVASLDVSIFSCASNAQIDGFVLSAQNGFDDEQDAEKGSIEKLLKEYRVNHLNQNL